MNFAEVEKEAAKFRAERAALLPAAQKKVDLIEELLAKEYVTTQTTVAKTWDDYRARKLTLAGATEKVTATWAAYGRKKRKAVADTRAIWAEYKRAMKVPFKYAGM